MFFLFLFCWFLLCVLFSLCALACVHGGVALRGVSLCMSACEHVLLVLYACFVCWVVSTWWGLVVVPERWLWLFLRCFPLLQQIVWQIRKPQLQPPSGGGLIFSWLDFQDGMEISFRHGCGGWSNFTLSWWVTINVSGGVMR